MDSFKRALICAATMAFVQGCADSGAGPTVSPRTAAGDYAALSAFESDAQMLAHLQSAARTESARPQIEMVADGVTASPAADGAAVTSGATSGTNTQVAGVDEADLLKVVGESVFALHGVQSAYTVEGLASEYDWQSRKTTISKYRLSGPAALESQAALPDGTHWQGLYARPDSDDLIVLGVATAVGSSPYVYNYGWETSVFLRALSQGGEGAAFADVRWDLQIDGQLVGSRRVGDTLYLVTEYGASYVRPQASSSAPGGGIDSKSLSDWLPSWQYGGVDRGALVSSADCYASPIDQRRASTRITTVLAIPLGSPEQLSARCLSGTAETLFVSQQALYVATTESYFEAFGDVLIDVALPEGMSTDLHKFHFDETLSYGGGVRLQGHLGWHAQQRSYRMGERDGVLSVVTSGGRFWGGSEQKHRLYSIADGAEGLVIRAELPNDSRPAAIGKPGERIYGTRVVDDRVYVVTFLTTDPLYVIDISDSFDPYIAGELEVPGFSDYLHPISSDLLLGIGKSAQTAGDGDSGRGGWYQGLRLSLFDVSDPAAPALINALEYGDRGSSTDVFSDVHALAWLQTDADAARFALPVNLYRHASPPTDPWQHGDFVHRGLYQFSVDSTGLREQGVALLPQSQQWLSQGRPILSNSGEAWFFDAGELYHAAPSAPATLLPSTP